MSNDSSNPIIDINAAVITLKIVGSIFCGIATAYFEYWLFGRSVVAVALAPIGCGLLAASFFAPERDRSFYFAALLSFITISLVVGGLVRIPAYVYLWTFAILGLAILGSLALYCMSSISPETVAIDHTATSADTCDQAGIQETQATRRAWTYDTRNRVWNKFDRRCYICHQSLHNCTGKYMHLDYRHPISKGGLDTEENLAACCVRCNLEKHDHTATSADTCDQAGVQETQATRRAWTYKTRNRVWNKFDRRCYICHQSLHNCTGEYMHLDHRHPISKGGPDIEENLAACCIRCNLEKHDHDEPSLYTARTTEPGRTKRSG